MYNNVSLVFVLCSTELLFVKVNVVGIFCTTVTCVTVTCRKPDAPEVNPEERDARTVVCMQLASRIRSDDLEEFFSSVGKVLVSC